MWYLILRHSDFDIFHWYLIRSFASKESTMMLHYVENDKNQEELNIRLSNIAIP